MSSAILNYYFNIYGRTDGQTDGQNYDSQDRASIARAVKTAVSIRDQGYTHAPGTRRQTTHVVLLILSGRCFGILLYRTSQCR